MSWQDFFTIELTEGYTLAVELKPVFLVYRGYAALLNRSRAESTID